MKAIIIICIIAIAWAIVCAIYQSTDKGKAAHEEYLKKVAAKKANPEYKAKKKFYRTCAIIGLIRGFFNF